MLFEKTFNDPCVEKMRAMQIRYRVVHEIHQFVSEPLRQRKVKPMLLSFVDDRREEIRRNGFEYSLGTK